MKGEIFFIVLACAVLVIAQDRTPEEHRHFKDWCKKHNKKYASQYDEETAMDNLMTHKKTIDEHNKEWREGRKSYKMALSSHHDMTIDDMRRFRTGGRASSEDENPSRSKRSKREDYPSYPTPPASIDWREKGLVGPIKNQEGCGSCWSFSVTAVLESILRKQNRSQSLSEQQLIDCPKSADYSVFGCSGGFPGQGLDYVKDFGITTEKKYPYKDHDGTCEYTKEDSVLNINEVFKIPTRGNETWMKEIVGNVGPITVLICLEESFYHVGDEGVYKVDDCCRATEHAPAIVGYGTDPEHGDYWILRNSWGPTWGDNGYVKFARNYNDMCIVAAQAVYAT